MEAVQCNMCVDRFNWTKCDDSAKPRECSDDLVMGTHGYLAQYNINLNGSSTTADRQFRCFRLELEIDVETVQVFIRGCTYDDSFFCDGWNNNGAKATNCAVCSTEMCERNTTGDVAPTTTTTYLPSETTTTTAVSTIEGSSTSQSTLTTHSTSTTQSASTTHSTSTAQSTSTTQSASVTQSVSTNQSASTTQSTSTTQSSPVTTTVTTDEPCIVDWTTTTIAKRQSTTTTKVVEEVTSKPKNVTESDSQGQDLTTISTDPAENTPVPSVVIIATGSGAEGKYFGIPMVVVVLLVSIESVFIVKLYKDFNNT